MLCQKTNQSISLKKAYLLFLHFLLTCLNVARQKIVKQRYQINVLSVYHQSLDLISVKSLYFNGYGIRWFLERKFCRQFDANIVHNNIDNMFFPWSWEGLGGIVISASWEKHFISIYENLSQYPRILYPFILYWFRRCSKKLLGTEEKHQCNYCNKEFKTKYSLEKHINFVHLKIKDHHCKFCDYKTHTAFNLR